VTVELTPVPLPRAASRQAPRRQATAWPAFAALAALAGAYLLWLGRGNTFNYDEWTWVFTRHSGVGSILHAYNSQMLIAPLAIYQLLLHTVGLRAYWAFRLLGVVAHLGLATVLFAYARRRIGMAALPAIAPLLVLGYGWESVLWPINFSFTAALAFAVAALLALERPRGAHPLACVLLVASLAFSELALVFAAAVALELSLAERSLRRAWVWAVPVALYLAWWVPYYQPSPIGSGLTGMPSFAARRAAAATAGLLGLDSSWGRPLLVAVVALLAARFYRRGGLPLRAAAVIVAACLYWLLVAYGRNQFPDSPRYIYTGAALLILIGSEALRGVRIPPAALAGMVLLAAFSLAGNLGQLRAAERGLRAASQSARAELGALELTRPFVSRAFLIDPAAMPGMVALDYFAAVRALHSSPADAPAQIAREPEAAREAADALLLRAGELTVAAGAAANAAGPPPGVATSVGGALRRAGPCVSFRPAGEGASLALALPATGLLLDGAAGPAAAVRASRFASLFGPNQLTRLTGSQTLLVRARRDADPRPWRIELAPAQAVSACTAA
jgi:hypothetical protein